MAQRVSEAGVPAVLSYAGRVNAPRAQPIPVRVGGFGGFDGLVAYMRDNAVTHLIDATHPFADRMSRNAIAASAATGVPLLALTRARWRPGDEDRWTHVPDIEAAIAALDGPAKRVFLAIGRMEIDRFARHPQHHYLLRFVDTPHDTPPLPRHKIVVARGPFDAAADTALLRQHDIELVVCKNSGGTGARAKLEAARTLGIPVLMVDRPVLPKRTEAADTDAAMAWLDAHSGTLRGV